jgi:hypothetical protein
MYIYTYTYNPGTTKSPLQSGIGRFVLVIRTTKAIGRNQRRQLDCRDKQPAEQQNLAMVQQPSWPLLKSGPTILGESGDTAAEKAARVCGVAPRDRSASYHSFPGLFRPRFSHVLSSDEKQDRLDAKRFRQHGAAQGTASCRDPVGPLKDVVL